jgi:hypothetical protein
VLNAIEQQVAQFKEGKHALAWAAMEAMPTIHGQLMAMTEGLKGCGACHKIGLKSEEQIKSLKKTSAGFGVASCDACHTRHTFSKKEAQQPQACQTCHMGFDHPQWEMYSASKHGVRNGLKQMGIIATNAAANSSSPRLRRNNPSSFAGASTISVLPFTATSPCSRNLASVREKVSLTVSNSAASTRLVIVNEISTG